MKVYLLYPNRDWNYNGVYFDAKSLIQDLGLQALFSAAGKGVVMKKGRVSHVLQEDTFLSGTMEQVMMVPLETREEILYRQAIMNDCLSREGFTSRLYELTVDTLEKWDKLGRRGRNKNGSPSPASRLMVQIRVLKLFVESLTQMKELFEEYHERLYSQGFQALKERMDTEFSEEIEGYLNKILKDISFYTDIIEHNRANSSTMVMPKVIMNCELGDGLKLGSIELEEVSAKVRHFYNPNSALAKIHEYVNSFSPDSISIQKGAALKEQAYALEFQTVSHVMSCCAPFLDSFDNFFDQLRFELAFYRGAVNLRQQLMRFTPNYCFPVPAEQNTLHFTNLKELVLCLEQRLDAVGNTCEIDGKQLLIVTGANQGGKSTFLRSIAVAQLMMQCGLFVAAESFESGIFPRIFTHFTRREDSAMNSGRLDEELKRMSQIIENLGPDSLIFMNESFASTTEKEGSAIAYDIIRALSEEGIKILTVTHLLTFAQRVYDETQKDAESKVEFLSAERLQDGCRTFRMIRHAPELTSFGLDLYEEIVER